MLFITENFLSKENEAELIIAPIMKKKERERKSKKECWSVLAFRRCMNQNTNIGQKGHWLKNITRINFVNSQGTVLVYNSL